MIFQTAPTQYITTLAQLQAFCADIAQSPFMALDTEFQRERTYWPRLCVLQIATETHVAVVDALAPDLRNPNAWGCFVELLNAPHITKIMHASSQDLEIFWHLWQTMPTPFVDTQIWAMALGHGDQIGYAGLVENLTHFALPKEQQRSDWTKRPLSPAQMAYAATDVTALAHVYPILHQQMKMHDRLGWIAPHMAALADPARYAPNPETAWERLRFRSGNTKCWAVLKALAAWREDLAVQRNVPRQHVLGDEGLMKLAEYCPNETEKLLRHKRYLPQNLVDDGAQLADLLAIIVAAATPPFAPLPQTPRATPLPPHLAETYELLRLVLNVRARQLRTSARLLAETDDLQQWLTTGQMPESLATGWRADAVTGVLGQVLQGELSVKLNIDKHVIELV